MAMLKSINKMSSAPAAPETIPDTALILVEINGQVFRLSFAELAAAIAEANE